MTARGLAALAAAGPAARDAPALAALVREAVVAGVARCALYLRLSRLAGRLNRDHHHRLVQEALEPLLQPRRARLFELPNGDLVVLGPPASASLHAVQAALTTLLAEEFSEAPFETLHLPGQAAALLAAVEDSLNPAEAPAPAGPAGAGFGTADLAAIERNLATASLESFLRRRPVCRLPPDAERPELAWEEARLDWPALQERLFPELDPGRAPWLQRRLQRLLDRRRLADLAHPEDLLTMGAFGLPLTVPSLTEPAFLRFDSMLSAEARRGVVIGLAAVDLLADPEGFAFARDFCRTRGYRLALDEAEGSTVLLLPADRLGVDVVRLRWSPGLPGLGRGLRAALPRGPEQVVLTDVDRAAAIGWGWEEGFCLFEGPLLAPRARPA